MKWYSYEKSTCVHESISHCLSRARMQSGYSTDPIDLSKDVYGTATFQDNGYTRSSHHILYDQYNTETNIDTRILDINRWRPDVFAEMPDDISKNNVISLYKKLKIPRWLELWSCITPWKCGARQNPLWNIYERKVYVSYNGHDMVCTVKYWDTDKSSIRIDSLEYKNIPINTFGIRSHQINLWLFGAKPLEYTTQVPNDVAEKNHTLHGYTDIRDIINHSPLHQKLKKIVFSENIRKNDSINSYKLWKSVYIPRSKSQPTKARVAGIWNIRVDLQNWLSYYIQSTYPVRIWETTSYTDIDGYDVVGGRVWWTSRVTMYTVRWIDNWTVYVKHLTKQELDETNS